MYFAQSKRTLSVDLEDFAVGLCLHLCQDFVNDCHYVIFHVKNSTRQNQLDANRFANANRVSETRRLSTSRDHVSVVPAACDILSNDLYTSFPLIVLSHSIGSDLDFPP